MFSQIITEDTVETVIASPNPVEIIKENNFKIIAPSRQGEILNKCYMPGAAAS